MVQFTKTFYGKENESLEKEIQDKKDSPKFMAKLIEQSPEFQAHKKLHPDAKVKPREEKKDLSQVEKVAEKWDKELQEQEAKGKKEPEKAKAVEYGEPGAEKKGGPIYGQPGKEDKKQNDLYGGQHSLGHYDCNCGASFELKEKEGKSSVGYISPTNIFKAEEKGPGYSGIKSFAQSSASSGGYATGGASNTKGLYR